MKNVIRWQHLLDVLAVFMPIILIGVSDVNRVLAVIFSYDHFSFRQYADGPGMGPSQGIDAEC